MQGAKSNLQYADCYLSGTFKIAKLLSSKFHYDNGKKRSILCAIILLQCQSTADQRVAGVCPTEYSNKCNIDATDATGLDPTDPGFPSDLCGCQDPSLPNPPAPTTFCTDASKICKADTSGNFGCQDCTSSECPDFAPLCDTTTGECLCGSKKPFGNSNIQDNLNLFRANICSGSTATDMFVCATTGNPCDPNTVNPYCVDNLFAQKLGDLSATCKVLKFHL